MENQKVILAYSSQYAQKYFFNDELGKLPEEVRKEVLVLLIMLTEEAGGVAEMGFYPDGELYLDSWCEEGDLGYDQVSAGLIISEIERDQKDLIEELELWYKLRTQQLQ